MATDELQDFSAQLAQDVHARADSTGTIFPDAFFDEVTDYLINAGEIDEAHRAYYDSGRGIRVDGHGGDPRDSDRKLTLIASDPVPESDSGNLTQTEMDKAFRRLEKFIEAARSGSIQEQLDPAMEAWELADLLATRWSELETVRLIIITNRPLSSRVDRKDGEDIDGVPVTYGVWDVTRLHRFVQSGAERETLEIDFLEEFERGIPVLPAKIDDAGYEAYVGVIPGPDLAAVYDRWGARLLEQNVRVFLQARSKVNKGIKATLEHEPHMFLAYNNGIAATAEAVDLRATAQGLEIVRARNLQIVNGGQTTASIHRASRTQDLDHVFVQMKLAVIEPDEVEDVVPRISEYANSQNRVSAADFFSNHPFHVRVEELSRRIYAPSPEGEFLETKWFYERARGQYYDAQSGMTAAEKRKFKKTHPTSQKFTKTDLAKFLNVWRGIPHVVSLGAQKNFAKFAEYVAGKWGEKGDVKSGVEFDDRFFKHVVAKGIVFRSTEKLVSASEWYEGGYRANIVAYSIAKLAHEYEQAGRKPDFERIWERQAISGLMERALYRIGREVSEILTDPPEGIANVTEWAKKKLCWERVQALEVEGLHIGKDGITLSEERTRKRDAKKKQRVVQDIEYQVFVLKAGGDFWQEVLDWGSERKVLGVKERGILQTCSQMERRGKYPSEKQCPIAVQALLKLRDEHGCPLGTDLLKDEPFG